MHTLAQLKAGQLQGITRLKLAEQLTEFPREIFDLEATLEVLDLSNNCLNQLPNDMARFQQLKILFLSNNHFTELPRVLAACPALEMIGFKANKIALIPEDALPLITRWLILTDNLIAELPESIGQLTRLEKLMLAGNQLRALPNSLEGCQRLALLRISANQLPSFPNVLLKLPKLSWLAYAGNPFCQLNSDAPDTQTDPMPQYALSNLQVKEHLGEGASGHIHRAQWLGDDSVPWAQQDLAVKLFKGQVTSDGYPEDELKACLNVGMHPCLLPVFAQIHDDKHQGLLMPLIPQNYRNLGNPPSMKTCTRDTFDADFSLSSAQALGICSDMASTLEHLHARGIAHGDVYAHNILIDEEGQLLFGDFGAASPLNVLNQQQKQAVQAMETRALAHLIDDLLSIGCFVDDSNSGESLVRALEAIHYRCFSQQEELQDTDANKSDIHSCTHLLSELQSISAFKRSC